ncbi:hypothetical protein EMCRGX_G005120 [Ephydatia muelleri]
MAQNGRSRLYTASCNGHLGVVKTLLEAGANINEADKVQRRMAVPTREWDEVSVSVTRTSNNTMVCRCHTPLILRPLFWQSRACSKLDVDAAPHPSQLAGIFSIGQLYRSARASRNSVADRSK